MKGERSMIMKVKAISYRVRGTLSWVSLVSQLASNNEKVTSVRRTSRRKCAIQTSCKWGPITSFPTNSQTGNTRFFLPIKKTSYKCIKLSSSKSVRMRASLDRLWVRKPWPTVWVKLCKDRATRRLQLPIDSVKFRIEILWRAPDRDSKGQQTVQNRLIKVRHI